LKSIRAKTDQARLVLQKVSIMNPKEKDPNTTAEELDPDWVNHWQEDDHKKEHTKQLTF
jgi:hypothetical protein